MELNQRRLYQAGSQLPIKLLLYMDNFEALWHLLKKNKQMRFVEECLKHIAEDNIIFHEGSLIDKARVLETYKDRYEVQQNVTNAIVLGYEELLENILRFRGNKIHVMTLITETNSYIIFTDSLSKCLIGVLKSPYSNIEKAIDVEKKLISQGIPTNYFKYCKGIRSN